MRVVHTPIDLQASSQVLVTMRAASRLSKRDTSLFDFDLAAKMCASVSLGWVDLASAPPSSPESICAFADELLAEGLDDVVLIGQGGSTQAAMVLTNLARTASTPHFHTMDFVSPSKVTEVLDATDPARTLYVFASKSGTTTEPLAIYRVMRGRADEVLGRTQAGRRFAAITDPGSPLEKMALQEGFRQILPGVADVGGRFSALSTFGLLPAALVGADITRLLERAALAESRCSVDSPVNPAVQLAAFLYDAWTAGRDKFSLLTPQPGRVFGLWVEQLIAESLGKDGVGILPNIEIDAILLQRGPADRTVVTFRSQSDVDVAQEAAALSRKLPVFELVFDSPEDLGEAFVVWEYATAMISLLMKINPFDQPDVAETKRAVEFVLSGALLAPPALTINGGITVDYGRVLKEDSPPQDLSDAIARLMRTAREDDYFALLSFVPFSDGRRGPLEMIRHCVAERLGIAACLEIGPRYLHSTGQLHKGGPDNGLYLIVSAQEPVDVAVPGQSTTLGDLQSAQAHGDLAALSNRNRRVLHIHLPGYSPEEMEKLASLVCRVVEQIGRERIL